MDVTGSRFRALSKIRVCCQTRLMGRCFSAHVAVQSLNSAMHRRLGGPLPHLLPNTIEAVPLGQCGLQGSVP